MRPGATIFRLLAGWALLGVAGCAGPDFRIDGGDGPDPLEAFAAIATFGDQIRVDLVDGGYVNGTLARVDETGLQIDPQNRDVSGLLTLSREEIESIRYRNGTPTTLLFGVAVLTGAIILTGTASSPPSLDQH